MHLNRCLIGLVALLAACGQVENEEIALVADEAQLLTPAQRERVALFHGLLLEDYDIDYRLVTSSRTGDIDNFAAEHFATIDAGAASRGGHGLLLVIDPAADTVRLEVGYALEGTFPDAFVAYIEQRQMVPFFASGGVADGILATTELIVNRAQEAISNAGMVSEIPLAGSGGAGASTAARLDAGREPAVRGPAVPAGGSPETTLAKYLAAMEQRNADPSLEIYTPDTRRMLADWVVTPAQMDSVVSTYRRCHAEAARIDSSGRYAVIRYPIEDRRCSPWFFERIDTGWALDLTMMQHAIRFGRDNSWHFQQGAEHPYAFAFSDWRVNAYGYPYESQ